jgi:predicted phosphodiesterase
VRSFVAWLRRLVLSRRTHVVAAVIGIGLVGAATAVVVGSPVDHDVGPVRARFGIGWAWNGGTRVGIAPLGAVRFDDHSGPVRLNVRVTDLSIADVRKTFQDPSSLTSLDEEVRNGVASGVREVAIRALLMAVIGSVLLSALVFRRWRPVVGAAATAVVAVGMSGGIAALTFQSRALLEPRYSGLLVDAPAAVGDVRNIAQRFTHYEDELGALVTTVSRLYDTTSTLPAYQPKDDAIRVLHVSDLHDDPRGIEVIQRLVKQFHIDVVADTGDISDHGTALENRYVQFIHGLGVPYVYVKGNHDSSTTVAGVKAQGAKVLDDSTLAVAGLRFFGSPDPRFTPDQQRDDDSMTKAELQRDGDKVAGILADHEPPPVDVAMVHDPAIGGQLAGETPVVLAGHLHKRGVVRRNGTIMLIEGSTGGAGLRSLDGDTPTPLECSILYFDRKAKQLQAYDDITVGGLGLASVQINRHVVEPLSPSPSPSPTESISPSGSPSPSTPVGSGGPPTPGLAPSPTPTASGRR